MSRTHQDADGKDSRVHKARTFLLFSWLPLMAPAAELAPPEYAFTGGMPALLPGAPTVTDEALPRAVALQQGDGNDVVIAQQDGASLALVQQRGDGNRVDILQLGAGHAASIVQEGNRNAFSLTQSGTAQHLDVTQWGDGLSVQAAQQ